MGILELFFSCVLAAHLSPRKQCDMVPIYCLICSVCQGSQARRTGESHAPNRGWPGVLRPPSFGPGEAAPFQKLCEDKKSCAQVRTAPSLCLAEPGWKSPLWIL